MSDLPNGATVKDGKTHNSQGQLIEFCDGQWQIVKNASRLGWWRYHEHYDRDGYCDNPARGY